MPPFCKFGKVRDEKSILVGSNVCGTDDAKWIPKAPLPIQRPFGLTYKPPKTGLSIAVNDGYLLPFFLEGCSLVDVEEDDVFGPMWSAYIKSSKFRLHKYGNEWLFITKALEKLQWPIINNDHATNSKTHFWSWTAISFSLWSCFAASASSFGLCPCAWPLAFGHHAISRKGHRHCTRVTLSCFFAIRRSFEYHSWRNASRVRVWHLGSENT